MKRMQPILSSFIKQMTLFWLVLFGSVSFTNYSYGQDASLVLPSSFTTITRNPGASNEVVFSQSGCGWSSVAPCVSGGNISVMGIDNSGDYLQASTTNSTINKIQVRIRSNNSSSGVAVIAFSTNGSTWTNYQELSLPANNAGCATHDVNAPAGAKYFMMQRTGFGGYTATGSTGLTVRVFETYVWVNPTGTSPTVATNTASDVTANSAILHGNLSALGTGAVTTRGFVVGTSANPAIGGAGVLDINETSAGFLTGDYSLSVNGLTAAINYFVRSYASSIYGISYGPENPNVQFTTPSGPPSVTTGSLGTVTTISGIISGNNVTATGGATVTSRGVVYNTTGSAPVVGANPPGTYGTTVANGSGTGSYNVTLSSLSPGTTYHAWAYATNANGSSYGDEVSFTTKANYHSKQSGDWEQASTWQIFNGTTWIDAVAAPTSADGEIEIVAGHTVTVNAPVTADQVTINGTLKVDVTGTSFPGLIVYGTYQHNIDDKGIPDATWHSGSELLLTGFTTPTSSSTAALGNMAQDFANITFDCPAYNTAIGSSSIVMVSGAGFSMKAGSKLWFKNIGSGGNITLTSTGNVITIPILQIDDDFVAINRNAGGDRTVNVGDLIMNGGTLYINWGNGNSKDGTLELSGNLIMSPGANMEFRKGSGSPRAFVNLTGASKNLQFGIVTDAINFSVTNGPATLLSNWPIPAGSLNIDGQLINTGSHKLSIGSGVAFSRTSGYINGNFEKGIAASTASKTFEIGDASNYSPVTVAFSGNTNSSGSLVASTTATDHPDLSNSGINPNKSVNRYFKVENNGVSGFTSYNISLDYANADVDADAVPANFKVAKYNAPSTWLLNNSPAVIGTGSVTGSSKITATGFVSFSEFAIGEEAPTSIATTTTIENAATTYGSTSVILTANVAPGVATGDIEFFVGTRSLPVGVGFRNGGQATLDFDPSGLSAGIYPIKAKHIADGIYLESESGAGELVIHPKNLDVTITADSKEYDGNSDATTATGTVSGIVGSDDVSVVVSGGQFDDKNVGVGKPVTANLALMGDDKDNYTIDLTAATTANIKAKDATIAINASNKTYDGTTDAAVAAVSSLSGVVEGDEVSASASNGHFATENAGTGIAVTADVVATGDDAGNYTFNTTASTTADINQIELTVEITAEDKTYDGNASATVFVKPFEAVLSGDDVTAVASNGQFDDENAGEDKTVTADLSLTGADAGNYSLSSTTAEALADINKAQLTVTVKNEEKLCGQKDPTNLTGSITGAVNNEVFTATYSIINETTITAAINENTDNYDVVVKEATLTINGVTIDASASSNPVKIGVAAVLSATISPVAPNVLVHFYLDDTEVGTDETDDFGVATFDAGVLAVDVYKVKAEVGGGCSESIAYLPVYDPDGAFVTGGGWIMSPAGAYTAGPNLTGKANFGFNAKYKKGSNAVDGNTEFQFQAGNLNFKSTINVDGTLVIASSKAIFKGKGTINGVAGYSFMVSAIDGQINGGGGVDKFRIKIWNTADSKVIYDNGIDPTTGTALDENAAPVTSLGGGSIVIHEATTKGGPKSAEKVNPDLLVTSLDARLFNNPAAGASSFRLKLLSPDADHPINLKVVDMTGKSLHAVQGAAGQTVEFGAMYRSGMYIAEITQNGQRKLVKLVKQ